MPPKRKAAVDDIPTNTTEPQASGSDVTPTPTPTLSAKRQRVSRACDQCRAAREKCDGVQPLCFSCVSQNRLCTYQTCPKKRGVQTGYIRTLEIALAWVFEKVSGSEESLNAVLTHQGGQGQALLTGKDPGGGERLHKRWRKSRVHKGIDRMLSGESVPISGPRDGCSPSPEPSDMDAGSPEMSSSLAVERPSESELDIARLPDGHPSAPREDSLHPRLTETRSPHQQTQVKPCFTANVGPSEPTLAHAGLLRLPENHWRLLDIYFSYTHSWLPILGKQDIFQASYLYPAPGLALDPREPSSAAHAELWSALALASFQDSANSSNTSPPRDKDDAALPPAAIYLVARSLIPLEDGPFQIHHCRALLLLSLANLGRGQLAPAGLLVGSAIRIALDINHGHAQQSANNGRERQRIHSVLMACFIIDTIISARDSKPPHLKAEDMHQVISVQEDGLDQWEPWTACEGFGTSFQGARAARSPAYCLSTFNQIYRIFKLVSREMLARSRNLALEGQVQEEAASFISELHQAVDTGSPFGMFSSSTEIGSSPVPTAYLIRVIYLWGAALLAPRAASWLDLIRDTLDHYERQFGTCTIPPIIPSCLASLTALQDQSNLFGGDKRQAEELLSRYSIIWGKYRHTSTSLAVYHVSQPASGSYLQSSASVLTQPGSKQSSAQTAMVPIRFTTPSPLYGNSSLQTPRFHASMEESSPINTSAAIAPYHQSAPILTTTATGILGDSLTNINPIPVHQAYVQGGIPAMQISQQRQTTSSMPPTYFNDTSSIYYDPILDDLASIDCADPVDVDPRFMANLGFAPGSDFSEIYTRGFNST